MIQTWIDWNAMNWTDNTGGLLANLNNSRGPSHINSSCAKRTQSKKKPKPIIKKEIAFTTYCWEVTLIAVLSLLSLCAEITVCPFSTTETQTGIRIAQAPLVAVLAHISSLHPQAALSIHGIFGGPMLGLFTLGIIFPCVNWKVRNKRSLL